MYQVGVSVAGEAGVPGDGEREVYETRSERQTCRAAVPRSDTGDPYPNGDEETRYK